MTKDISGGALAFALAFSVIYLDSYQAIRKTAWRVPEQFWKSVPLAALSTGCGLLALGAFVFSLQGQPSFLRTILGADIDDHIARGAYTGVAVLALIRSKLFQVRDADVGLEYLFFELRSICLRGINIGWTKKRNTFVNEHLAQFIARVASDASFDGQVQDLVKAAVINAEDKTKTSVESQLTTIAARRPVTAPTIADPSWATYCRALLNLALENCGPGPFETLLGP